VRTFAVGISQSRHASASPVEPTAPGHANQRQTSNENLCDTAEIFEEGARRDLPSSRIPCVVHRLWRRPRISAYHSHSVGHCASSLLDLRGSSSRSPLVFVQPVCDSAGVPLIPARYMAPIAGQARWVWAGAVCPIPVYSALTGDAFSSLLSVLLFLASACAGLLHGVL